MVKLGIRLPEGLVGRDHGALRALLSAIEDLGYGFVGVGEHVVGVDRDAHPDWKPYFGKPPLYDQTNAFHEPMVVFGLLSALSPRLEFSTGVLISPQRQTALLAKQTAEADFVSGGRIRLVLGSGWNDIEYEALGVDFATRGKRLEEQVEVMRLLWTHELVTYKGAFHTLRAVGINPLPVQRPIPVWFGGTTRPVLRRTGQIGDGWFPSYPFFREDEIRADLESIHDFAREAGRDPGEIGFEGMAYFHDDRFEMPPGAELPPHSLDEYVGFAHRWKEMGATHFRVAPAWAGAGVDEQIKGYDQFVSALGPDF